MNTFFVSTPIGFENATLTTLKEIWPSLLGKDSKPHGAPLPAVTIVQGGLEFEADFFTGLQLNFFLKTANRVLLRMDSFKARDLPKFYQKFKALPWKDFFYNNNVFWEVAAQTSRLNNEKRLRDSAEVALRELFTGVEPGPTEGSIYIRVENDQCTVSIDTTGEHLHKRGWSVLKGEAPLRETIASYLLQELIGDASPEKIAEVTLVDPMVGAGTFLTEARAKGAGQFSRPFAFQKWKRAPKLFLSPAFAFNYVLPPTSSFKAYVGADVDKDIVPAALKNFAEVERQLASVQKAKFTPASVTISNLDSLDENTVLTEKGTLTWMIVNPPYGERLESSQGLAGLAGRLTRIHTPERLGILYPEKERLHQVPHGYKKLKEVKINNGGLRCLFTVLTRL